MTNFMERQRLGMNLMFSKLLYSKSLLPFVKAVIISGLILVCGVVTSCSNSIMGPSTVEQDDPEDKENEEPNDPGGGII